MLENSREGNPDNILPPLPGQTVQRYLWNGFEFLKPEKNHCPAGWRIPVYTDILHLGRAMYDNVTEHNLWLHWLQPGVIAYYPTFDGHGPVVGPWPGREPKRFWQNNMPVWETRQLPRMVSYTWKQQDNISAFWTHQYITDVSMHCGIQNIPAINAMGHAYMARIPVTIQALPHRHWNRSCLSLASMIVEPYKGVSVWGMARELLQTYELVNKNTGAQAYARFNPPWGYNDEIVIRPFGSGRFWSAPYYDMPWRHPAGSTAFYNAAIRGIVRPSVNILTNRTTDSNHGYYLTKSNNRGKYEIEFYPGLLELSSSRFDSYHFDYIDQRGLGAYLENALPLRFVRAD